MEAMVTKKLTVDEFRTRYVPDAEHFLDELMEGEIIHRSAPSPLHQRISGHLFIILNAFVKHNSSGEVFYSPIDVILNKYNLLQPDIIFISEENKNIITHNYINGAPDLVIEIISPSSVMRDRFQKKRIYEQAGVKEYWLVSPEYQEIEVLTFQNDRYELFSAATSQEGVLQSSVLKDLQLNLKEIF